MESAYIRVDEEEKEKKRVTKSGVLNECCMIRIRIKV